MAKTIYFQKESNGNVTIRNLNTEAIIYALQPTQNLTRDIANPNGIIIKSAISSFDDRGIVIDCRDIEYWRCNPAIYPIDPINDIDTIQVDSNDCIVALMRDYFFCGSRANQFPITSEPISVGD
jgi:hypothetical protein